jgi:hypothetical protein
MNYDKVIRILSILSVVAYIAGTVALLVPLITLAQDAPTIMATNMTTATGPNGTTINIPVSVASKGPLALAQVYIAGRLTNTYGTIVADSMAGPVDVPVGTNGSIPFSLTIPPQTGNMTFRFEVGFTTPPLLSMSVELRGTVAGQQVGGG